jgi:hypothetical protein
MSTRLPTPSEFCQLTTDKEKDKAYSDLWDAWQYKGVKKEGLNKKVKKTKRQRQKGASKTNALANNARDFLIEEYWNDKHSGNKLSAKLLLRKLHQKPKIKFKHLTKKVVERWYTAIKKTWDKSTWPKDEDAFSEFSDKAIENHRILIKRKPKPATEANA